MVEAFIVMFLVALALVLVFGAFFIVRQQEVEIIERLGKFSWIATSGFNVKIPFIDKRAGKLSFRVQQLDVQVETKTKDNVFVTLDVSLQMQVNREKMYEAFYMLTDTNNQVSAYIFDVVRAQVPMMPLDEVFEKKDDVAKAVREALTENMKSFGYDIVQTLVTDIDPAENVKAAMNDIEASKRIRVATLEKAEAEKTIAVKKAEAESESKKLQGEGIAAQRKAIINGLRESVKDLGAAVKISEQDALNMVLVTQYFDTLKEIGDQDNTKVIMMPNSPTASLEIASQIRNAMITAKEV